MCHMISLMSIPIGTLFLPVRSYLNWEMKMRAFLLQNSISLFDDYFYFNDISLYSRDWYSIDQILLIL